MIRTADVRQNKVNCLLLLAAGTFLTSLASDDLAKHNHAVAVHEGDTGEALAVLEGVADKRLLRLEAALGHLVRLQGVRFLHLLATGLFAHLPLQGGDAAGGTATAHEADWRIADFDLVWDVQHLNLSIELFGLAQSGVLLVHHHVTGARHVLLVQTLDVQANVVTRVGEVHTLVVHLHSEHLASAWVGAGVSGQEDHLLTRLHLTLLNTAGQHITHTLDLVDARDGHAHWGGSRSSGT